MTDWDALVARSPGNEPPEPAFTRFFSDEFVNNKHRVSGPFLDIGCGRSARHTRAVLDWGTPCIAIDGSKNCLAHHHGTWENAVIESQFACIIDIKTLCHAPEPNYQKAHDALVDNGWLFVMCPTDDHIHAADAFGVAEGKDFTRMATEGEMRDLLKMFPDLTIRKEIRPIGRTHRLYSWVIEARK